jgi:hypothetical protein
VRRDPLLYAVILIGVAARAILIPLTHGQDFVVWDKASAATLRGVNIYAHHPNYPGGPFAYFPLFVYLEVPFQWIAQHTPASFLVLGKVPIAAADLVCALAIAEQLRTRGYPSRTVAAATAAFFLNPLVLYNSAYYGRFDTVGCALLLLAVRGLRGHRAMSWGTGIWYGLAVAAKTFPAFVFFGVLRAARRARLRLVVCVVGVVALLSVPYLSSPHAMIHDIVVYDAKKPAQALSWQHLVLRATDRHVSEIVGYVLLAGFVVGAAWLAHVEGDLERYVAAALVLFILCSRLVLEQYLVWPMPWLALLSVTSVAARRWAAAGLMAAFSALGMLDNESLHPLGRSSAALEIALGVCCVGYLAVAVHPYRRSARMVHKSVVDRPDPAPLDSIDS